MLQHEIIQEQITRVLLERLIVNRPHPWGLLITFIELIKVNVRPFEKENRKKLKFCKLQICSKSLCCIISEP